MAHGKVTIDISGPDGNGMALISKARLYGKQLGWSKPRINSVVSMMTKGDYKNLIRVFEDQFSEYVELVGKDNDE